MLAAAPPQTAGDLYKQARQAEKRGDSAAAYLKYAQAAALDPEGATDAWLRSLALRTQALIEVNYMPSDITAEGDEAIPTDPALAALLGEIEYSDLEEAKRPLPPIELQARAGEHSFELEGTPREVFEEVAGAYGLDVIFDGDFQKNKPLGLRIESAGYREALHIVCAATATFLVPVSETMFLVAEDTQQKRQELEHNMAVVIPLPETVGTQEAQELAQAVQQVMEIQKLVVDTTRRMVLLRDRVSRVRPAEALFQHLLHARAEVVIEVEFIEFARKSTLRYGIDLPKAISIAFLGLPGTLGLWPLGGPFGVNLWGFTIGDAELVAAMSRNSTRTLLRSMLRSVSGQTASLHVGDRFPIQTNAYIGGTSLDPSAQVYAPPPQINFEDLGVVVNVTPHVHGEDEVSMELEAEFQVLAGQSLNGLPVLANRNFQAFVRLKTSEWAVISGLVRSSEARNITGIAGLSDIPYLGKLFSVTTTEEDDSDVLLLVKPTIVRTPASGGMPPLWTGTETRPNPLM